MYLYCPKRKQHDKRHTDRCLLDKCEYLRSVPIDKPDCQQEHYACDYEQAKQRGEEGRINR